VALEKDNLLSPIMEKARNEILNQYSDSSFDEALDGVKSSLKTENDMPSRLALLAAKSWIIRNKVHVLVNEPFTYSLSELEGTNIFSENEDEDEDTVDGLFDDDDDEGEDKNGGNSGKVKIVIIKATTLNGDKLLKDATIEVGKDDAEKLILEKKAKYAPDA
jgi:hypothetical protein|tara:strand:+ start:61 stop:546 length:486 start_codon:yes stop_codon:yes gene_type:complete